MASEILKRCIWMGFPIHFPSTGKCNKTHCMWICMVVGHSFAATLELLAHCRNVTNLTLFYRYYFSRCASEVAELVPLPYSWGRSTCCSDRLHDFSIIIPRCYKKDVYINNFFPRIARIWNSLPVECFPLTYDLSGLNRHLLTVTSFWTDFLYALIFLCFFFL